MNCDLTGGLEAYSEYYRKIQEHPCFSAKAVHHFGRMHLAVAPKCNIQCNYCIREFDCVDESRPGVTSKVLSPAEAVLRVREVTKEFPNVNVIGIAGPGEPLFNEETFTTLSLVHKQFPRLDLCLSTNGLLLPEKLDFLKEVNLQTLTVTVNTVNPEIGARIYSHVLSPEGRKLKGVSGAKRLLKNQLEGIARAVEAGIVVKVNTVMIPAVNDSDILNVAQMAKDMGVYMLNVMPLIPQYRFSHVPAPAKDEIEAIRKECEKLIKQMRHCRQCRRHWVTRSRLFPKGENLVIIANDYE